MDWMATGLLLPAAAVLLWIGSLFRGQSQSARFRYLLTGALLTYGIATFPIVWLLDGLELFSGLDPENFWVGVVVASAIYAILISPLLALANLLLLRCSRAKSLSKGSH